MHVVCVTSQSKYMQNKMIYDQHNQSDITLQLKNMPHWLLYNSMLVQLFSLLINFE